MLCARLLKAHDPAKKPNIVLRVFERMFDSLASCLRMGRLDWVLAKKALMLLVTLATLVGTVYLYMIVPKGFFPAGGHRLPDRRHRGRHRHVRSRR